MVRKSLQGSDENRRLSTDALRADFPRRSVLRTGAVGTGIILAGCLDSGTPSDSASTTETSDEESQTVREQALNTGLDLRKSVVKVEQGTGWILDDEIIVTCSHVADSETVSLESFDGETTDGSVIGRHEGPDLAVVESDLSAPKPLSLGSSIELNTDDARPLIQIGHPNGVGTWIISLGTIEQTLDSELLADIPCGPGSSGSPLMTLSGDVVGMTSGTTVRIEGAKSQAKPETVYEEFPERRLLARAKSVETINRCIDHLI